MLAPRQRVLYPALVLAIFSLGLQACGGGGDDNNNNESDQGWMVTDPDMATSPDDGGDEPDAGEADMGGEPDMEAPSGCEGTALLTEPDRDRDGLKDCEEDLVGTDPDNPDTDGDGLDDFDEIDRHRTDPLSPDTDMDGLSDSDEINRHRTDPLDEDTDGDGLSDAEEVNTHNTDPLNVDTDGDGLDDAQEVAAGSDPNVADSDMDGLTDGEEVNTHGTDPTNADTDMEGVSDGDEIAQGTDPTNADTDGDGLDDGIESATQTDPTLADTDMDGIDDGREVNETMTDPTLADTDFDGLSDGDEVDVHGTDPFVIDTDGDGVEDSFEVIRDMTDPLSPDTDMDGLTDGEEVNETMTDPNAADTDMDGLSDSEELAYGLDPNKSSTFDDGIMDSMRDFVTVCQNSGGAAGAGNTRVNMTGDWSFTLPTAIANYTEHTPGAMAGVSALATFSLVGNEAAAGAIFATSARIPEPTGHMFERQIGWATHDGFVANSWTYRLSLPPANKTEEARADLIYAMTGTQAADFTPPIPTGQGDLSSIRVVRLLEVERGPNAFVYIAMVANEDDYLSTDATNATMRDLTAPASLSQASAAPTTRCEGFAPRETRDATELYWVLDQSGSMSDDNAKIQNNTASYLGALDTTMMDWRVGVTNMSANFAGSLRAAGWHTDAITFDNEIQGHVIDCTTQPGCSGGLEHGLYNAREGLTEMNTAVSANPIRVGATVGTIIFSDEDDQSHKDLADPDGVTYTTSLDYLDAMRAYFIGATSFFTVLTTGNNSSCGLGEDAIAYRTMAYATDGISVGLCENDSSITNWYREYIVKLATQSSSYTLPTSAIPSTVKVYVGGQEVTRSRTDGFEYIASSNAVTFFGASRPALADPANNVQGDSVAITYQTP